MSFAHTAPIVKMPIVPPELHQHARRILRLKDYTLLYRTAPDPVVLDRINFRAPNYGDQLRNYVHAKGSEFTFVASCDCKYRQGNYWEGMTCPVCKTPVVQGIAQFSGQLVHRVFLEAPDHIPGFLHPVVYTMLTKWLSAGKKLNYIDIITNPSLELPRELQGIVLGRGWRYLHDNFDFLMHHFAYVHPTTSKKAHVNTYMAMISKYRHLVFQRYLPVLSSILHPIIVSAASSEDTPEKQKKQQRQDVDAASAYVLQAANTLAYIRYQRSPRTSFVKTEKAVCEAYHAYIQYTRDIIDQKLSKKPSLPRRHMKGSRLHLTYRTVIVPIAGAHSYDELHLPWSVAVNLFRVHILNFLINRYGYSGADAVEMQHAALVKYNPIIHEILNWFIANAAMGPGVRTLFNRNPSLKRGSVQMLRITKIKTDPDDDTIAMSTLVTSDANADFDGRALPS